MIIDKPPPSYYELVNRKCKYLSIFLIC